MKSKKERYWLFQCDCCNLGEVPESALLSGEIQVDNGQGTAPLYANQIWIGTKGSNPTPLANWVIERIGTQTNEVYQNFWVYPAPITYLQLELKNGNTDNKSGLRTDVLIVDDLNKILLK